MTSENFFGLSAPAGLPAPIVEAMHRHVAQVLEDPKVRRNFEELAIAMRPMTPAQFAAFVIRQVNEWAPAVKASGARLS
ncbi:MAG TPA: tripartite tricarboxylate transporter substrate-binding protein [Burkholderiaceae bacterium]|nr:tripartite tricarboxylate transporter substrate-binding protein [Burkholderiaceae bacterium]